MAYQSIFSSKQAPAASGGSGGGYQSVYGSATIQAPSPQALATSRQQRTQAKQKQDDQAKAQAQAEAKQQADKAKQSSLFNQIKTGTKAFVNDAVVGTAKSAYNVASTVPKEAQVLKAKYGTPNDQKAQKQAVQNKKDVTKNIEEAKSLLRFAPRAAIQVGESIPVINKHPSENNTHVTDKAPTLIKAIVGKEPIPSIQKTYKDTKQKEGTGAAVGHTAATILGDALAFKGGKDAVVKTEKAAGSVKAAAGRDEAVNRLTQQSLFDISSKLRTPKKALDEAQAQQLATETAEKNKVAASKVDQKIELIEAKKADGKFTNVDKVKVKQLQAEKQQLTGDTAPSTTPKPLVADAAVPAKPGKQTAAVSSEASIAPDEGKVFYHGTNNPEIKTLADLQTGKEVGKSSRNRVYITENPEVAKNFGSNVVSSRLYGKHLNAADIGVKTSPDPFVDKAVAKEFSDYKTSPLLSEKDKRVFENSFVKDIPNNTIIEDTPNIHKYLASKGYATITVPRIHSDVNGPRTETIIIDPKAAHTAPQPTQIAQHPATGTVQQHMAEHYKPVSKHPDEAFAHEHLTKNTSAALHAYEKRTKEIFGSKNIVGGDDAIKQLADHYKGNDSVQIRIIDNSRGKDNSIPVTLDFLKDKSYTKSEIEAKIHTLLDDHLKEGKISHEEHAVFKGQEPKTTTPSKPQQQVGQSRPDVRPVERPPKPEAERQPQPTGQSRQVAATKVTSDTASVTDAKTASRVYERLKAEHPELQDDVSYDAIKLKEDSQKAVDLLAKDKQKAFEVAMGQTPSSEVTSTAVNIAMAEKALQEGNHKLYAQLITNRSLAQTRRGQELVAEKGSVTDNSTARYVKELLAARLDKLGKKYMNDLDLSMKKLGPKERATAVIDKEVTKLEKQIKRRKLDTKTALSMLKEMECLT